ncbi:hypothetical protein [Vibrio vulnificus]|uniref:hypothetical protein n=1 Tax=Vibrio vulnificus TaxID=672 RepID=UPI0002DAAEAE|nr:hypothetical protein [Vibrio vulnificus]ELI0610686.1 hypothetical protein [Vibrio vulnificus]MCA3991246.1 hypothetical protein [Vibrio vulnificus]MCU8271246.1 hypothetical protein [Vibrio vulnificus]RZQ29208.1 hypothetical protein D8T36_05455 [Vibrio vulnificus]RZR38365.1 hypothetical protein D8T59_11435 [Vibrio vulnificus]
MNKNERLIQFFDVELYGKTNSRGLTQHTFDCPEDLCTLFKRIKKLLESKPLTTKLTPKSRSIFTLSQVQETAEHWIFLVRHINTEAKNVVRNDQTASLATREEFKFGQIADGKVTGLESSSHLIIKKKVNSVRKHLCLFEKTEGFNFVDVVRFFNMIFSHIVKKDSPSFTREKVNEPQKTMLIYPKFGYLGHPSSSFLNDLASGTLTEITLTAGPDVVHGYDQSKHCELQRARITMSVKKDDISYWGGNRKYLNRAVAVADSLQVPEVRIAFKDINGASHSAQVDTRGMLINADKYVKKTFIKTPIESTSETQINSDVVNKMLELP